MTKTKPPSNTQRALEALRQMIFSGELAAGTDHLETELAQRLNMSRTPVREAAMILESQGLLEVRPRKGVRILSVSPQDMTEIYDVLTELECLSAAMAAAADHTPQDLAALSKAIDDMDAALLAEDRVQWARADDRFHRELVRLGGNSRVISIVEMMNDQVRRARATTLYMRPRPSKSNDDHRDVLQAIRDKDPVKARACHHRHRQDTKTVLIDLLEKHQLRSL